MRMLRKILKGETGQALPIALILLVLGGLLIVPLLLLMTTSINYNRTIEQNTLELYAADAGVEKVLWNLQYNDAFDLPGNGEEIDAFDDFSLNNATVDVKISKLAGQPYKITSTATSADGDKTTVECYLNFPPDFSWLFDSAITSPGQVTLSPNVIVSGNVTSSQPPELGAHAVIKDGGYRENLTLGSSWPDCEDFKDFYLPQVAGQAGPTGNLALSGDSNNPTPMGPWYCSGSLAISNNGYGMLDGPIYVAGNFNAENNCTINLNGEAIFAEGTITISNNTVINGPGAIIACGEVYYACNTGAGGNRLIGVNETLINNPTPVAGSVLGDRFILSRFNPILVGTMSSFHVYCTGPGHVKLAIYDDNGATPPAPTTRLNTIGDNVTGVEVQYGWNTFNIDGTGTPMVRKVGNKDKYYWLAANSDAAVIGKISQSSTQKWTGLAFPDSFPAPAGTLTNTDNTFTYLFSGWSGGQEFIMVMSVEGYLTMKNNGTFYGSVAAEDGVTLENNDAATLVNVPGDGLNFPGGGGADDDDGAIPTILTYTIK